MMLDRELGRRFVETMLYWRHHLRAKEIQDFLGVSERTARNLIRGWRIDGIFPPYRAADGRRLIPSPTFTPDPAVKDPNVALSLLLVADRLPGNPFSTFAPRGGGATTWLSRRPSHQGRFALWSRRVWIVHRCGCSTQAKSAARSLSFTRRHSFALVVAIT